MSRQYKERSAIALDRVYETYAISSFTVWQNIQNSVSFSAEYMYSGRHYGLPDSAVGT